MNLSECQSLTPGAEQRRNEIDDIVDDSQAMDLGITIVNNFKPFKNCANMANKATRLRTLLYFGES